MLAQQSSSLQAPDGQHTETGLPVQVEKASTWVYLLTGMLGTEFGSHLGTHTDTQAAQPLCMVEVFALHLPLLKIGYEGERSQEKVPRKGRELLSLVIYYLC